MSIPTQVKIVEVGPRDGLQNEEQVIDAATKIKLVEKLTDTGLRYVESGSFVNPKWIPQMADSKEIFQGIKRKEGITYAALTPNIKGYQRAIEAGATEVAIFGTASEAFCQKNINCSIEESIARFQPVMDAAKIDGFSVRAYVSCALGCPYEGAVATDKVCEVTERLVDMGCYEISICDTIGVGTPGQVVELINTVANKVPIDKLAIHFHDTYGQALANIYAALQLGISVIDSSVAGLGGCPYAKGATGNVATEDVVYMLNGLNIETGVDLDKLIAAGNYISDSLGRPNQSRVAHALSQ